jgi:predicted nuclease with RNAse H fold
MAANVRLGRERRRRGFAAQRRRRNHVGLTALCNGDAVDEVTAGGTATLGIDLSADPARTAACAVAWRHGAALVEAVDEGLDDVALHARIERVEADGGLTGIDAPFAWPVPFREALDAHARDGSFPAGYRDPRLQFRATDLFVAGVARRPLSVSTNLIGVTAMRCARLLHEVGVRRGARVDPAGTDGVAEVYPAAALVAWGGAGEGLDPRGYKVGPQARGARGRLVAALAARGWLHLPAPARDACERSDHALDAVLAALAARAVQRGLTHAPKTPDQRRLAPVEGWIHVPVAGSLDRLAG